MPQVDLPLEGETPSEGVSALNENDYGLLKMHCLNSSQRQADGAGLYAENLRYSYLEGKENVSLTEALGPRYIQGPHPQWASPDAKGNV